MYQGYLDSFHKKNPDINKLPYETCFNMILNDTTEFAGSYYRNFKKLGIDADFVISNDPLLQNKWLKEKSKKSGAVSDILLEQVRAYKPEVLWIEDFGGINNKWISDIKKEVRSIRLVAAYHCAPYNQSVLEKLKSVDFVITCTPGIKQDFESKGIRTYLVYHGFDSDLLLRMKDNSNTARHNLVFSGSLFPGDDYHNERIEFIERLLEEKIKLTLFVNLEKSYKIRIKQSIHFLAKLLKNLKMEKLTDRIPLFEYGRSPVKNYSDTLIKSNHNPVFGIDMYNLFDASDTVLNMHVGIAGDWAGNMRIFEVTGVGSCLLTDNKKNIADLFDVNNEILVYDGTEDCIEKINWLIGHEDERKRIAESGQQKTLKYHTVENRCMQIADIITGELNRL
jgi:spore maturation protein CgeB